MTNRTIYFYAVDDEYGELSNFAAFPITVDGVQWPTSEHYFQAQKFAGTDHEDEIRAAAKPMTAARMGRERSRPLRADWESVKYAIMLRALRAKFTQHPRLAALLRSTADATLVEHTANDSYWADGGDGGGKNMLGVLLMQVRRELESGELEVGGAATSSSDSAPS
jgi:ribA/ribD-fused uncharacterized protein